MKGYFRVLRSDKTGLARWAAELQARGIPANFNIGTKMLSEGGEILALMGRIAGLGFEMGGSCDKPFWGMSRSEQYDAIKRMKDGIEDLTGRPMLLFSSKYSAYTEDTLAIADELGIPYLFGRGVTGESAAVFRPKEYSVRIISTSDVSIGGVPGTLADGSFWSRGASPEELKNVLLSLRAERITFAVQSQLSGVKVRWRDAVRSFLDSGRVEWKGIQAFCEASETRPFSEIPVNDTVDYLEPLPLIPLEKEEDITEEEPAI